MRGGESRRSAGAGGASTVPRTREEWNPRREEAREVEGDTALARYSLRPKIFALLGLGTQTKAGVK